MRALLAALATLLAALGLQLAMVVGVVRPSLLLALLGYAGLFAGMVLVLAAALRRMPPRPSPHRPSPHRPSPHRPSPHRSSPHRPPDCPPG